MSSELWTIKRAFDWTRDYLTEKGDYQARLSTEWLLAHACELSRLEVYTQFDRPLSPEERNILREAVRQRAEGQPLQYIVGSTGFRHLDLEVKPGVLIPRPETEVLVDLALQSLPAVQEGKMLQALDLCTGSGCVGLSLAYERPDTKVIATDISDGALELAEKNTRTHKLEDRFITQKSDLFDGLTKSESFDLIVSNPPYIPTRGMEELPREVKDFEPALALHGGKDGLDLARKILQQASFYLADNASVILELDVRNAQQAAEFAVELNTYTSVNIAADLSGQERFVLARK
jgi:release factor glutamine methyltransferase